MKFSKVQEPYKIIMQFHADHQTSKTVKLLVDVIFGELGSSNTHIVLDVEDTGLNLPSGVRVVFQVLLWEFHHPFSLCGMG